MALSPSFFFQVWIRIQANTFKNWANVTLREAGGPGNIENLETDFQDGTKLVALVETLQKRKLKHNKKPINQHHEIENITIALDAIQEDGLKLVNIGKTIHIIDDIIIQILVHSVVSMTKIVWRGVRSIILSIFGNSSLF